MKFAIRVTFFLMLCVCAFCFAQGTPAPVPAVAPSILINNVLADPERNFMMIIKDGKIYKNTLR